MKNKKDIYASVFIFLNKYGYSADGFFDFLFSSLDSYDKETLIIASVDFTLLTQNMEMYDLLITEFNIRPSLFLVRAGSDRFMYNTKVRDFFRQIKIRTVLNG